MTLLFIITSILYLLMVFFVLSLYYNIRKFEEDIENRLLQFEKMEHANTRYFNNCFMELYDILNGKKEGDDKMACKKGKGGRKK